MNTSEKYYRERLYPFQDGILRLVKKSATPFYLTGGTALSRRWFGHRYSDGLDLFVDSDPRYAAHVDEVFALLKEAERGGELVVDQLRLRRSQWHTQLWVARKERGEAVDLKIS
jgi:predicted nucleotidyltransferase component of viral defense system